MKTKLKLLAGGIFMAMAVNSYATDGAINFHGEIITQACIINGYQDIDVPLGTYSAAQFVSVGDPSPKIPFTIPLTNCPYAEDGSEETDHFRLWLEAPTVPDHPNLIQIADEFKDGSAATGVGIRIVDAKTPETPLEINSLPTLTYKIEGDVMNVNLMAYYESFAAATEITAGLADAVVNVTLDYR